MKWHRVKALLLKCYYLTINSPDRLCDMFYWPLIDLFVWGFASFYIKDISDVNVLSALLGGIILWVFVWRSSQDIAVYVLEDFWGKNLYHLFSSPVRFSEHLLSIITFSFFRALASGTFMALIASLLYSFSLFSFSPLVVGLSIFLLSLFGWTTGLFVTALIFRFGQRIQVLAWSTVWIIQPFSCVFYPLSSLPVWGQWIARLLPTTYIFENMRAMMLGHPVDYSTYAISFIISMIFFGIGLVVVHWSFQSARKMGMLEKGD